MRPEIRLLRRAASSSPVSPARPVISLRVAKSLPKIGLRIGERVLAIRSLMMGPRTGSATSRRPITGLRMFSRTVWRPLEAMKYESAPSTVRSV